MVATKLTTAEDLEMLPEDDRSVELFDGVLREHPGVSVRHGYMGYRISGPLYLYLTTNRMGELLISDTQFLLARDPDTIVKPDVSYIHSDPMSPPSEHDRISRVTPDFVVEIISPSDRPSEAADKIRRYQAVGVPLLWYVDPVDRSVTVHVLGRQPQTLREGDVLDGGEVFPGFTLPVSDIFA